MGWLKSSSSLGGLGEEEFSDRNEPKNQTYVLRVSPFWDILSELSTEVGGLLPEVEPLFCNFRDTHYIVFFKNGLCWVMQCCGPVPTVCLSIHFGVSRRTTVERDSTT